MIGIRSGFEVPVLQWGELESAQFGIIVFHGMTEHAGRYDRLGEWAQANHGCVIAANHVGHGDTRAGALGDLGPDGWEGLIARNARLVDWVLEAAPQYPWVILGHSMGSFIAQEVVSRYRPSVKGIVLTGASYEPRWMLGIGWTVPFLLSLVFGKSAKGSLVYRILYGGFNRPFRPARTPFDWLSRWKEVVDSYIADPLCGFIPPLSFYMAAFGGFYQLFSPTLFAQCPNIPLLILTGAEDSVTHFGAGSLALGDRYREAGNTDVTVSVFKGLRHVVLNELGDEVVYRTLRDWLSRIGSDTVTTHSN